MTQITDPEVRNLAALSATLEAEYASDDAIWKNSPFGWIKARPSRRVGTIGERLVSGWLAAKGFNVSRSPDAEADRVIEGKRVEIKFSTLWATGLYKFQQLRDQNYEFAVCLGVSPFDAHGWVLEKSTIMELWGQPDGLPHQHGGSVGTDTVWLSVNPRTPPHWLNGMGGRLRDALECISALTGYKPTLEE